MAGGRGQLSVHGLFVPRFPTSWRSSEATLVFADGEIIKGVDGAAECMR